MKTYRDVEYEILPNHIKFYHELSKRRIGGEVYTNGVKYISIPAAYVSAPTIYAKRIIDRTYEWANYHKKFEERKLKKNYLDIVR